MLRSIAAVGLAVASITLAAPASAYPGSCDRQVIGFIEFYTCRDERGVIVDTGNCDVRESTCFQYKPTNHF